MRERNRYTRLTDRIRRKFEKIRTEDVNVSAGGRELIANADDEEWRGENDPFGNFAPYNYIRVSNSGAGDARVYLSRRRDVYFDVAAGESFIFPEPYYFSYVSVEETGETDAADVTLTFGRIVDSRELDVLKMAGQLDIPER